MGLLSTLRTHWKKSLFGAGLVAYGISAAADYYQTQELLRQYCEEARNYGHQPLPVNMNPKHLTVILNPAAKGRKAKDLFEKYCAPILYLAGYKVSIVQTEHIGQARSYMDIMENTDAIVVAGGDGTLGEVVTGLLRRHDGEEIAKRLPLAVLPIGFHNDVANALFYPFAGNNIKMMAESAMAIIRDSTRMVDVVQIDVLEEPDEEGNVTPNKPVYALGSLQWGAFRDADLRTEKYWYLGPLRSYATYFWGAFKDLTWNCSAFVKYTPPCSGCSRCSPKKVAPAVVEPEPKKEVSRRWWQAFVPRPAITPPVAAPPKEEEEDFSHIDNPECGEWHSLSVEAVEFNALATLVRERRVEEESNVPSMRIYTGPKDISTFDFMQEGFQRVWNGDRFKFSSSDIFARSLEIHPVRKEETSEMERWYSIDNDNYEVRDIRLTILPKKIRLYCAM